MTTRGTCAISDEIITNNRALKFHKAHSTLLKISVPICWSKEGVYVILIRKKYDSSSQWTESHSISSDVFFGEQIKQVSALVRFASKPLTVGDRVMAKARARTRLSF